MYVCAYVYAHTCVYIYIYIYTHTPGMFLASSCRICLNCEVLKGMLPWWTRYPLS